MNRMLLGASLVSVALATTVGAQSNANRDRHAIDNGMAAMNGNTSYVGCIESVNHNARFILTHVADGAAMNTTMKTSDSKMAPMKQDDMKDMKHDEMKDMKHEDMKSGDEATDMMVPATLALKATTVDLRKHVGQKVSLTGMRTEGGGADMTPALAVTALKVVAKSCR